MNLNTLARVNAHNHTALKESLKIVRKVVASNPYPDGFTTAELFKLVAKEPSTTNFKPLKLPSRPIAYAKGEIKRTPIPSPPRPNHPIKSMTCVYSSVCKFLCDTNLGMQFFEKIRAPRSRRKQRTQNYANDTDTLQPSTNRKSRWYQA